MCTISSPTCVLFSPQRREPDYARNKEAHSQLCAPRPRLAVLITLFLALHLIIDQLANAVFAAEELADPEEPEEP
eukprot:SAG11_NODE_30126_length_304_cov_0.507317_1_plen_74_part_10